jgi:hypothetical protein
MSSPKSVLTSLSSQPHRLRDSPVLGNIGLGLVPNGLPVEEIEDVHTHEVAVEVQKKAKQICNVDRERFRQFYDDELQRKRPKKFLHKERPGASKTFQGGEGYVESNKVAQEKLRARQEQRIKDDQLLESGRLARQRVWQEQRVKDDQFLESCRLAKQEQRVKDDQLRESRRLAKQRARQEQRVRNDQLLESYRLAKLK